MEVVLQCTDGQLSKIMVDDPKLRVVVFNYAEDLNADPEGPDSPWKIPAYLQVHFEVLTPELLAEEKAKIKQQVKPA